ncbi:FBP domain-containing protein [Streptomyces hirsutus]
MRPLTDQDIRGSFVNCSKGEAKRLFVPRDLGERVWEDLDFLGWRDPGAPDRAYLVTEQADQGGPVGWHCGSSPLDAALCSAACARCA